MLGDKCKSCSNILTLDNCVHVSIKYIRNVCKSCRSKKVMIYNKNNEKRKSYMNERARKIGIVKEYPCETCGKQCYKTYKHAFCSIKCRFLSYIEKTKNCWLWKGAKSRRGYGKFMFDKFNLYMPAHRSSYILFKGKIPEGFLICHTCDNPPCVNPEHLWIGSHKDNAQDCIKKGRFVGRRKRSDYAL